MKVKITWGDGAITICTLEDLNRFIALYGQPLFEYEIIEE